MPSWIARLVQLDDCGDRRFRAVNAQGAGPRLFGGLIAAQALAAAAATVEPDRLPQSLHAYFIKGGRVGIDVDYVVETTRDGRSFNTRRVTASQQDVPIFEMLASFHRPESTVDWQRPVGSRLPLEQAATSVRIPEGWMRPGSLPGRSRNGRSSRSGSDHGSRSRTTPSCGHAR